MKAFYLCFMAILTATCAQAFELIECPLHPIDRTAVRSGVSPLQLFNAAASSNWSGYVAASNLTHPAAGSVTFVSGSWMVPTLHATPGTSYSAIWVGIDGFSNNTVEQIGTAQDWSSGSQQNYAWFEMYPTGSYEIVGFPVTPGDLITASVSYIGNNTFQLSIDNVTQGVSFIVPTSYTKSSSAQRSSAEWIVEAPSSVRGILPLANFGQAALSNCIAKIGGFSAPITNTHWQNESIGMQASPSVLKAVPSALYGLGLDFMVSWQHQ